MPFRNDVHPEQQVRVNIRFACWEHDGRRERWAYLLAGWLGLRADHGSVERDKSLQIAERVLSDAHVLDHDQLKTIADVLQREVEDLFFENWPRSKPGLVLQENLRRLLAGPSGSTKAQLAGELDVNPATLSRWINGSQLPDSTARRNIVSLFGLRDVEELENTPIFLSYLPVTHGERVAWLDARLRLTSRTELQALFPALARIFSPEYGNSTEGARSPLGLKRNRRSKVNR